MDLLLYSALSPIIALCFRSSVYAQLVARERAISFLIRRWDVFNGFSSRHGDERALGAHDYSCCSQKPALINASLSRSRVAGHTRLRAADFATCSHEPGRNQKGLYCGFLPWRLARTRYDVMKYRARAHKVEKERGASTGGRALHARERDPQTAGEVKSTPR